MLDWLAERPPSFGRDIEVVRWVKNIVSNRSGYERLGVTWWHQPSVVIIDLCSMKLLSLLLFDAEMKTSVQVMLLDGVVEILWYCCSTLTLTMFSSNLVKFSYGFVTISFIYSWPKMNVSTFSIFGLYFVIIILFNPPLLGFYYNDLCSLGHMLLF